MTQTLTREQVLAMERGPELDALVAQHVMGWHKGDSWGGAYWEDSDKCSRYEILVFKPSLHINIAWEVQEQVNRLSKEQVPLLKARYLAELSVIVGSNELFEIVHASAEGRCKAALLAVLDI